MGLDGGTIPSRADILRRSSWRLANTSTSRSTRGGNVDNLPSNEPNLGTKQAQARQKWNVCSLSGEPLRTPIVVDELGKLYNRTSVLEFLLGEGNFVHNKEELKKNGFGHITSIKNVFEVHLTPNDALDSKTAAFNTETTAQEPGRFICPVTQLETNGMHQFCVLKPCGHVLSEKALNLFQELKACWTCNVPYTKEDVIPINGNEKAVAELEERLKERLDREKEKKDKKRKRREEKRGEKGEEKKEEKKAIEAPKKPALPKITMNNNSFTSTTISSATQNGHLFKIPTLPPAGPVGPAKKPMGPPPDKKPKA